MRKSLTVLAVLAFSSLSFGQEYLTNGSFDEPAPSTPCAYSNAAITGWTGVNERNKAFYTAPCNACDPDDLAHVSMDGWGNGTRAIWQTVTDLAAGVEYELTGYWWIGHMDTTGSNTARAELRDGPNATDPLIGFAEKVHAVQGDTGAWLPFSAKGTPTGTTITVVITTTNIGSTGFATHVDCCSLHPNQCVTPVNVENISPPAYGARGTTVTGLTINGSGFIAGQTTVKLQRQGSSDIVATNVTVYGGGTSLTCDVDLTGAALGRWNVRVDNGNPLCQSDTLASGFNVVLPAFSNGSFESPTVAKQCPVPTGGIPGWPTDWLAKEIAEYGYENVLLRDSDRSAPTCDPLPDGLDHYASSLSDEDSAGAEAWIFQTFKADPTKSYTFSGQFAGGGNNIVTIELHDGDDLSPLLNSTIVRNGGPATDWASSFVSGQPTGDLLTVMWHIKTTGGAPHAAHADALTLLTCENPAFKAEAISPADLTSGAVRSLTISGLGFSGGSLPQVSLSRSGHNPITATDVIVVNDTTLTCNVDLTGATSGLWDVLVAHDGCVGRTSDFDVYLLVVAPALANGEFELKDVGPVQCGPPPVMVPGVPEGWSAYISGSGAMDRDMNVHSPVCPCPLSTGGHYGSLTTGPTGLLVAYQVLRVTPGVNYVLTGNFAGAGRNEAWLAVYDGFDAFFYLNDPLASQTIHANDPDNVDPGQNYDWTPVSLSVTAPISGILAVTVQLYAWSDEVPSALHMDGLTFEAPTGCNATPQDSDGDQDVDLVDFGQFQACFNGPNRPYKIQSPPEAKARCECLDVERDNDVDLVDFGAFQTCFNGPNRAPKCGA